MGDKITQRNVFGANLVAKGRIILPNNPEQRVGWFKGFATGVLATLVAGVILHLVGVG